MQPNKRQGQSTPVMDIQKPTSFGSQSSKISPSPINSRPATMEYTRPRNNSDNLNAPNPNVNFAPQPDVSFTPATPPKKSKAGLVITAVIILFLVIMGGSGAYYYFAVESKTPVAQEDTTTKPTETKTEQESGPLIIEATPEGVDRVTSDIDKQLNTLDDTQDFSANDVSDASLGL